MDAKRALSDSLNIERCGSELVYAPGSTVRCELPHDHTGLHVAGHFEWRVGDNEGEPQERPEGLRAALSAIVAEDSTNGYIMQQIAKEALRD